MTRLPVLLFICCAPFASARRTQFGIQPAALEDDVSLLQKTVDVHSHESASEIEDRERAAADADIFAQIEAFVDAHLETLGDCAGANDIIVIDQGGTGTKALYFGARNPAPVKIWTKDDHPALTVASLKRYIQTFIASEQKKVGQDCKPTIAFSFAAQTFSPGSSECQSTGGKFYVEGSGAWSKPPSNLKDFKPTHKFEDAEGDVIVWGCEFGDLSDHIYAANDIQVALIGGWNTVREKTGVPDNTVLTFVFGTSPNGGYVTPSSDGSRKINVAGRMGYMYGRIVDSAGVEGADSASTSGYKPYLAYKPSLDIEKSADITLSLTSDGMTSASTVVEECHTLSNIKDSSLLTKCHQKHSEWPQAMSSGPGFSIPYTTLMRNANVGALTQLNNNCKLFGCEYLDPNTNGGQIWRQRMTQAAYGFTHAFMDENGLDACKEEKADKRFIMLLGGNSAPLGGKLHECIFTGAGWMDVITNADCKRKLKGRSDDKILKVMADMAAPSEEWDTNAVVIANFGHKDCKFNVIVGAGDGNEINKFQSMTHISGAKGLTNLNLHSEDNAGRYAPYRKPTGYTTEDANLVFTVKRWNVLRHVGNMATIGGD